MRHDFGVLIKHCRQSDSGRLWNNAGVRVAEVGCDPRQAPEAPMVRLGEVARGEGEQENAAVKSAETRFLSVSCGDRWSTCLDC